MAYACICHFFCVPLRRFLCEVHKTVKSIKEIYGKFSEVDSSWRGLFKVVQ